LLFGAVASPDLQASFKVTKTATSVVSDNDIKSRIITAVNQFFTLDNWNFGDTFYFTELSTYIMNQLTPDITNFIIVPRQDGSYFGSLFEIKCPSNQIFINGATVSDIEIIKIDDINHAYERMQTSDVNYRFVIDIAQSLK
jgi:hypothetical protein